MVSPPLGGGESDLVSPLLGGREFDMVSPPLGGGESDLVSPPLGGGESDLVSPPLGGGESDRIDGFSLLEVPVLFGEDFSDACGLFCLSEAVLSKSIDFLLKSSSELSLRSSSLACLTFVFLRLLESDFYSIKVHI